MADEKKEPLVKLYDPTVNAYRDVPLSTAEKFSVEAPKLGERIKKAKEEKLKDELLSKHKAENEKKPQ